MGKKIIYLLLLFVLCFGFYPQSSQAISMNINEPMPSLITEPNRDLSQLKPALMNYDINFTTINGEKLMLHVHVPTGIENSAKLPTFVWFPGGGYVGYVGMPPLTEMAVNEKMVAVSVFYYIAKPPQIKHAYPEAYISAQEAIKHLKTNAAKYHIDPDKITVAGWSAGGTIAAFLGAHNGIDFKTKKPDPMLEIDGVIAVDAPLDFSVVYQNGNQVLQQKFYDKWTSFYDAVWAFVTENPKNAYKETLEASPVYYLSKVNNKNKVKWLLIHGKLDDTVPLKQSKDFYNALKKLPNNGVKLIVQPTLGHTLANYMVALNNIIAFTKSF
ncbi:MAG: hypothetical protein COU31_02910 [Candidatus Magasanikbacteria bacterium CG10_big_fil_rev_8_21_14_0_10_40_10]|uniref:BD-FAE-like domain-containing protein n=1 Tax=Candidatus Magasanikbacteria bacterium CG10_big_fil_rev_8_21_14_0_10_40_10 TaxID=1974648 RepID=A0A2M6W3Y0_9BACT|nr:MAG: hypothetical protein COU31_02910 [Candidatus Magasanikbacteria bacterium CG10_big_fil_rev_8_21_14_0_10_40_10]